jgi:hypothetical protein
MQTSSEPRPIGQLFTELARESGSLVRQEVRLASVEMTQKARAAGRDAAVVAAGGVIAVIGALAVVAALILLIGTLVPLWISALVVGGLIGVTGGVLVALGLRAFKGLDPAPRQTLETLEEDKRWLRQEASR